MGKLNLPEFFQNNSTIFQKTQDFFFRKLKGFSKNLRIFQIYSRIFPKYLIYQKFFSPLLPEKVRNNKPVLRRPYKTVWDHWTYNGMEPRNVVWDSTGTQKLKFTSAVWWGKRCLLAGEKGGKSGGGQPGQLRPVMGKSPLKNNLDGWMYWLCVNVREPKM